MLKISIIHSLKFFLSVVAQYCDFCFSKTMEEIRIKLFKLENRGYRLFFNCFCSINMQITSIEKPQLKIIKQYIFIQSFLFTSTAVPSGKISKNALCLNIFLI